MRSKRVGLAAAVALTSLAAGVPPHADADPGTDFLTSLTSNGIDVGTSSADVLYTLEAGENVCELLHYNFTPQDARATILYALPKATPEQVSYFVQAAQDHLCAHSYPPMA
jgi:Protein of unknown function (DUF732)